MGNLKPRAEPNNLKSGGISFLAGEFKRLRAHYEYQGYTVLQFDLGDSLFGSHQSFFSEGKIMLKTLKNMNYQGLLLGNLDIMQNEKILKEKIKESKLPYLASNLEGQHVEIKSFLTFKFTEFNNIAVLGLAPSNLKGEYFRAKGGHFLSQNLAELKATLAANPELKEYPVKILLSQHVVPAKTEDEKKFYNRLKELGFALVVGFHFNPEQKRSLEKDGSIFTTIPGDNMGSTIKALILPVIENGKTFKKIIEKEITVSPQRSPIDGTLARSIVEELRKIEAISSRIVGYSSRGLKNNFEESSSLGNFLTDMLKDYMQADICILSSMGFRGDVPEGPVNLARVYDIYPFGNRIVSFKSNLAELKEILTTGFIKTSHPFQISGLRVKIKKDGALAIFPEKPGMDENIILATTEYEWQSLVQLKDKQPQQLKENIQSFIVYLFETGRFRNIKNTVFEERISRN
ncbi:5'-nucleotidase C-terminal domain-containing protein [Candidatus Riflebacteria bacterium]